MAPLGVRRDQLGSLVTGNSARWQVLRTQRRVEQRSKLCEPRIHLSMFRSLRQRSVERTVPHAHYYSL
jgi:hypothetical protein